MLKLNAKQVNRTEFKIIWMRVSQNQAYENTAEIKKKIDIRVKEVLWKLLCIWHSSLVWLESNTKFSLFEQGVLKNIWGNLPNIGYFKYFILQLKKDGAYFFYHRKYNTCTFLTEGDEARYLCCELMVILILFNWGGRGQLFMLWTHGHIDTF